MTNPLAHPGWIRFNEQKWRLTAKQFQHGEEDASGTYATALVYVNAAGKLRMPPLNLYLPMTFRPTATSAPHRLGRQWLEVSEQIAAWMHSFDSSNAISLDPIVTDARPWQWQGFRIGVLYTFFLSLPYNPALASKAVRKNINKARRAGYMCERTTSFADVISCLSESENRQEFRHNVSESDLCMLQSYMGEEACRVYLCRTPEGEPASARVVLHSPESRAVDWIAGTSSEHLRVGSTQLLIEFILDDLDARGASGFDYGGANIPHVAAAKAEWGGTLVPYYSVNTNDLRALARDIRNWGISTYRLGVERFSPGDQ